MTEETRQILICRAINRISEEQPEWSPDEVLAKALEIASTETLRRSGIHIVRREPCSEHS